ncbi:MAG TPA: ABC transporter permease, partial [Gemmatimonadaceae bacterium]
MSARDWPRLRRLFRLPSTAARVRADVDKELHFHIDGRIEELMTSGLTRAEAEREARRRFGDYRRIESEVERLDLATHRRHDVQDRLEALRADFAYTIRVLAKQPVFTSVVVLTLTLAIAATTSIFHVVDRVVLNPLPYPEPDRIVYLGWHWVKGGGADALSPRSFQFWHDNSQVFDGLATARSFEAVVGDGDQSNSVRGVRLSADYLHVVRATPMIGRAFAPEEYVDPAPPVVMLTHAFWTTRFGADRSLVGRTIRLDGRLFTVIGVMPKHFEILEASDGIQVVTPFAFARAQLDDNGNNYTVVGRLKPNVTTPQIKADMERVFARYRTAYPNADKDDRGVRVLTYGDIFTNSISSPLLLLLGATSFVLLLAFANVANLLFARTLSRQREFALRTALGASRVRVAGQVVLEMLVLGGVSAVLATIAGLTGVRA